MFCRKWKSHILSKARPRAGKASLLPYSWSKQLQNKDLRGRERDLSYQRDECQRIGAVFIPSRASLVAQTVKRLPAVRKTWVWSLGWEDPLEKEMAIHFSTLAWKIPWMEEPVGYSPRGCKESDTTEWLHFHLLHHLDLVLYFSFLFQCPFFL